MKKPIFLWIAAIASAFFGLLPYFGNLLGGSGTESILTAAAILGGCIFLTAVFVLAVLGIYKSRNK